MPAQFIPGEVFAREAARALANDFLDKHVGKKPAPGDIAAAAVLSSGLAGLRDEKAEFSDGDFPGTGSPYGFYMAAERSQVKGLAAWRKRTAWTRWVLDRPARGLSLSTAAAGWQPAGFSAGIIASGRLGTEGWWEYAVGSRPGPEDTFTADTAKFSSRVQSVLIPVKKEGKEGGYTADEAHQWCEDNNFAHGSINTTENFHRVRQFDPGECKRTPKTITLSAKLGIKAVVCEMGDAEMSWDADEVNAMDRWELEDLDPDEAADILEELEGELDPRVVNILTEVAGDADFSKRTPREAREPKQAARFSRAERIRKLLVQTQPVGLSETEVDSYLAEEDPAKNPHLLAAKTLNDKALFSDATSQRLYAVASDSGTSYEADRKAWHEHLTGNLLNADAAQPGNKKPSAVIVIGLPASGKSTRGPEWAASRMDKWTTVSSTDIVKRMPEYLGWNAPLLQGEAADIASRVLTAARADRHNILLEQADDDLYHLGDSIDRLWNDGYDVHLLLCDTMADVACERAAERFLSNPFGQRPGQPGYFMFLEKIQELQNRLGKGNPTPLSVYDQYRDHPGIRSWCRLDTNVSPAAFCPVIDLGSR